MHIQTRARVLFARDNGDDMKQTIAKRLRFFVSIYRHEIYYMAET